MIKQNNLAQLEENLGFQFKNQDLLNQALTHRSFLNENKTVGESNERMEFLGDSILSFCISEMLYQKFPDYPEGNLTNIRSNLVKTTTLAKIARTLTIGKFLKLSHGEDDSGGRSNPSILADTVEAIIGAIFFDQGLDVTKKFILTTFTSTLEEIISSDNFKDPKSTLQEKIQAINNNPPPIYKTLKEEGPDHQKTFTIGVYINEQLLATDKGKSKREAEENAARKALENYLSKT